MSKDQRKKMSSLKPQNRIKTRTNQKELEPIYLLNVDYKTVPKVLAN